MILSSPSISFFEFDPVFLIIDVMRQVQSSPEYIDIRKKQIIYLA